jgi:hypothetical protein
MSQPQVGVT